MAGDPMFGDTSAPPAVDAGDAVRFLQQLVRLDTVNPPGHESRAADLIEARLAPLGLAVERLGAEPGRDCLLATLPGTGGGRILVFNGHVDVQPVAPGWSRDPFGAGVEDDRLYGNGVRDMASRTADWSRSASGVTAAPGRAPGRRRATHRYPG